MSLVELGRYYFPCCLGFLSVSFCHCCCLCGFVVVCLVFCFVVVVVLFCFFVFFGGAILGSVYFVKIPFVLYRYPNRICLEVVFKF